MITLSPVNAIFISILVEFGLGSIVVASSVVEFIPINMSRLESVSRSQILDTIYEELDRVGTAGDCSAGGCTCDDSRAIGPGTVVGSVYCGRANVVGNVAGGVSARNCHATLAPVTHASDQRRLCIDISDVDCDRVCLAPSACVAESIETKKTYRLRNSKSRGEEVCGCDGGSRDLRGQSVDCRYRGHEGTRREIRGGPSVNLGRGVVRRYRSQEDTRWE